MKVLFITIGTFKEINRSGIYTDLLRMFRDKGNEVYIICSREKRQGKKTELYVESGVNILGVRTGNITKVALLEKGISTLFIGRQYNKAFHKYLALTKFDLIMYSTPPITIASMIRKIKKKTNAFTYLMLKDIFPQNAIDLEILGTQGVKGIIYLYFRFVERKLYQYSDKIGVMSPANADYLLKNNSQLSKDRIEVCPNTIDVIKNINSERSKIRMKYNIPSDKLVMIYGGNFGKPQNVDFIVEILKKCEQDIHWILCGSGTEFHKVQEYSLTQENITCIGLLPVEEYVEILSASEIGLIFLDERFTIPNFPSRILDYMNYEIPILACTDVNTDLGLIIEEGDFGWWIKGNDIDQYNKKVAEIVKKVEENPDYLRNKGKNGKRILETQYTTKIAYDLICNSYASYNLRKGS